MTSNMIYIVALAVGFKCPRKIHLNTQCPPLKLTYYAEPELSFSSQGCDPLTRPNKHRNKEALEAGLLSYD